MVAEAMNSIVDADDLRFTQVSNTGPFNISAQDVSEYFAGSANNQGKAEVIEDFDLRILTRGVQARLKEQPYIRSLISKGRAAKNLEEAILDVFLSSHYRRGKREYIEAEPHRSNILEKIKGRIRTAQSIEVVLPSLPCKDKNPLRTSAPGDFVDLGEAACLARMYEICKIIEAIYPPGCKVTFLTDGIIYSDLFGVAEIEAINYRERIKFFARMMDVEKHISLVDMWIDVVCGQGINDDFKILVQRIEEEISSHEEYIALLQGLIEGIKPNLNLSHVPQNMLYYVLQRDLNEDSLDTFTKSSIQWTQVKSERLHIQRKARAVAIKYASLLIAIKKMRAIENMFPHALRATVHAKPGQLGLHMVNEHSTVLPYHGVPVWLYPYRLDDIRIGYEIEVKAMRRFVPVQIKHQSAPFYYRGEG